MSNDMPSKFGMAYLMERFESSQPPNLDYSKDVDEFDADYYTDVRIQEKFSAFVSGWREGVKHCA